MNTQIEISEIRIYCGTYAKYNNGSINGAWLNLSDYSDSAEFFEACQELHEDETDPEYMFQDYECPKFMRSLFDESMSDDEIQIIYDTIEAIDNSHLDIEIISAYIDNVGIDSDIESTISHCEEAYQGEYNSDEDFAESLAEELGYMEDAPKSWPFNCIDWEYAARELMYDYFESGGYYFRNN